VNLLGKKRAPKVWQLSHLLADLAHVNAANVVEIKGLASDSRKVAPGDLFFACAGHKTHGIEFIADAISAGAVAVLCEGPDQDGTVIGDAEILSDAAAVPVYQVSGLQHWLGKIAERFYGYPSQDMLVIGITGTNGKTSCSHYLAQMLDTEQKPCGLIGTLGYGRYGVLQLGEFTTPDAITLHALLAQMRDTGIRQVVLEVSSHALEQGRVAGIGFDGAIFTNLSRDHLDYHGDLETYGAVKQRLFSVSGLRYAVVNSDDETGQKLLSGLSSDLAVVAYGLNNNFSGLADFAKENPSNIRYVRGEITRHDGSRLEIQIKSSWGSDVISSGLLGIFNASNLLATLSMLLLIGIPLAQAAKSLREARSVPGRMEHFGGQQGQPLVVIDYAHTPDALEKVLTTLREFCQEQLWAVFGCGGDRDQGKRAQMGAVADRYADKVILTDDNPRSENGADIIAQIITGVGNSQRFSIVQDRAQAISQAISHAGKNDVVLIAGKGHEEYQIIGNQRIRFSDRGHVTEALQEVA